MSFATLQHKKESKIQPKTQSKTQSKPQSKTTQIIQSKPMCPCGGGCPGCKSIQAKLKVSQPNDPYEIEADSVTNQIMRMPAPDISSSDPQIQRKCSSCDMEEDELQISRKPSGTGGIDVSNDFSSQLSNSGGHALDSSTQSFMESRFSHDFSDVRIHDDSHAAGLASDVSARAFTFGNDIFLNKSESMHDKSLMAHELTHVIQQKNGLENIQRLIRTPYPWLGVITPTIGANIRSAPGTKSPKLDAIPMGETVNVLANSGNWLKVESRWRGPVLTGYIYHKLVDDATSSSMQDSVGDTMVWRPSGRGSGTDFELWASAPTETPFPTITSTTIMNCWEAVLLSAYRSGSITWNWIHDMYVNIAMVDWVSTMTRGATHTYSIPGPNLHMPQRGDLVFFDGLAHVALATGNASEVFTFWPPPNTPFTLGGTTDKVKIFTLEALNTWWTTNMPPSPKIEFGAPSW